MSITPRDFFECVYISRCMDDIAYRDAKAFMEERRVDFTYSDDLIAKAWEDWLNGVPWL